MERTLRSEQSTVITDATGSELVIEPARPGDGRQIARCMRNLRRPEILPLTIWSSPRAAVYVEDVIEGASTSGDEFSVVRRGGQIVGVVYLRSMEETIFVDSIYASPEIRQEHLVGVMSYCSVEAYAERHPRRFVALDRLESTRSMRALSRTLGAQFHSRRLLYVLPLPTPSDAYSSGAEIVGLAEADRMHAHRRFSSFRVITSSGSYQVGRLPEPFFRITCRAGIEDAELLNVLSQLDPGRQLLLIADDDQSMPASLRPIAAMVRSVATYEAFIQSVRRYIPNHCLSQIGVAAAR